MILSDLSNLFWNKGLKIEPNNSYTHGSIDTKEICKLFKKHGCILFRNYDFTQTITKNLLKFLQQLTLMIQMIKAEEKKLNLVKMLEKLMLVIKK